MSSSSMAPPVFAGDGIGSCTVDGCHPNDPGFFRMAEQIGRFCAPRYLPPPYNPPNRGKQ